MLISLLLGGAVLFFIAANIVKFLAYRKMPIHLRWELYPIPHENPARAIYGGSRLEETMWWAHPYKKNRIGVLRYFLTEVVLLKAVFEHNRQIWIWSWVLHTGLYSAVAFVLLLIFSAILDLFGVPVGHSIGFTFTGLLFKLLTATLYYASTAVTIGSLGLLAIRWKDSSFREMSARENWINLAFLAAISLSSMVAVVMVRGIINISLAVVQAPLTLSVVPSIPFPMVLPLALFALFLLYFPFTSMTHLYTKWFTYHSVRWDDTPNEESPINEKLLEKVLSQKTDWSAPHFRGTADSEWRSITSADIPKIEGNRSNGKHPKPNGSKPETD